uniref:CSON013100 protein n=1 Tax=Culicoides sonorensis TaxID=179676 RepID=A0A336KMY6_CULSO
MESVVQCPVCTLFLHPGMSLEDHLNTHPKDQVIQALSQLTLQRANILSGTQFSPAKSSSPIPPTTPTQPTTSVQNNIPALLPNTSLLNDSNGNQFPNGTGNGSAFVATNSSRNNISNSNTNREPALVIQVQTTNPTIVSGTNNNNPESKTSPHLFNNNNFNHHENTSPKNLMIVNQYVQQRVSTSPTHPANKRSNNIQPPPPPQLAITYPENPQPTSTVIPRYTSERYSGPPPPYSTAISSTSFSNFTTIASRDHYMNSSGPGQGNFCSNENSSSSSYEIKAQYMEKEDGNFIVHETPQKIVEYSEDENGVLTLSEKVVKSPPRLVPCSSNNSEDDEERQNRNNDEPNETLYGSEPILVEKVEKMTVETLDEVTQVKNRKKTTNGLKVLSNVKITTDMISPGLQEILRNKKGRRINKILNKRPQQSDTYTPSPPPTPIQQPQSSSSDMMMMICNSPQPSTSNSHCDDNEVMDLTQASTSYGNNRRYQQPKYEVESYHAEEFQITEMSSEDAIEQAEVMSSNHDFNNKNDEEHQLSDELTVPDHIPHSSTPTSVIRTINDIQENPIKAESSNNHNVESSLPPQILSPKPSTSSQDSHLNAAHAPKCTTNVKIGKPIVLKPKKLKLKLKNAIPCQNSNNNNNCNSSNNVNHSNVQIKLEPGITMKRETKDDESVVHDQEDQEKSSNTDFECYVKQEKVDSSTIIDQKPQFESNEQENQENYDDDANVESNEKSSIVMAEAGPSHAETSVSSSYTITYVGNDENEGGNQIELNPEEKMQYYPIMYLPQNGQAQENPSQMPLSWVQRFSPQYVPFDERSSYMDIDGGYSKSNSISLVSSEGDVTRNGQSSSNSFDERAPSTDSLNIRTDEKMPAKGEISEQESNGEIENWNQVVYQDPIQQYPSSYDVSTAQECWNLSNNKQEFMQHQQYATFPPLQHIDGNAGNRSGLPPFIPKEEKPDLDIDKTESSTPVSIQKPKRPRTYRCPDCIKCFTSLKQRRLHLISEHQYPEPSHLSSKPSSSGAVSQINIEAGCSSSTSHQQHMGGLLLNSDNLTGLSQIVSNFEIVKQEYPQTGYSNEFEDLKPFVVTPSQINEEIFQAVRVESKKMLVTYKCSTCNEDFKNLKTFNKHFTIHPAECALCGKGFNRWATYALHLKRHYNIRDYHCRICSKSFILRQKLVEHMRVHTGIAPIQCNICNARFRRYSNLAQHRNRHHLNKRPYRKDYVCECGETFVSQAKLDWHRETHEEKPKVCPFCRERFVHRNSLTRHIRLSHPDKYILLKNKVVSCPYCDKKYLQTSLKAHLETHSQDKNQFSCSICSKEFSTKWNLKQHQWTHANRSTKPFQCNICPNAFVRENDYTTHMNAHKAIRPYTCNHCGCQFVRKSNWMRHTREHEQEKNYTCERPFSCNICGKTSATKTNHNKHIKIHHARDPLTAEG